MGDRKMECASQSIKTEGGDVYRLTYEILIDEMEIFDSVIENYGIAIRMLGDKMEKYKELHAITANADEINRIAGLLSRGTVFPDDLEEVLENILI